MNDFFGLTLERVQQIQDQIAELGRSLAPIHDACQALVKQMDSGPVVDGEPAIIAAGGLLARLDQALGEAHFWTEGIQRYINEEDPDHDFYGGISRVVCDAYGGMRDMSDPYATGSSLESAIIGALAGGVGPLGGIRPGMAMIVKIRNESASDPEPAA